MSDTNKAIIRRFFDECLNLHNLQNYPTFYSDVIYRASSIGVLRGEEHLHLLSSLLAAFPDALWTLEDQIAEVDRVVTRWTMLGTHTGTFMGLEGTGRQVRCSGMCIARLADGRIVEEWEEWDTLGLVQQLSATAVPANVADMIAP